MKNMLEELWYGNIVPGEMPAWDSREFRKMNRLVLRNREELSGSLTDFQKEKLEKYDDSNFEMFAMTEKQTFIYAFRLGARFMLEMLQDET